MKKYVFYILLLFIITIPIEDSLEVNTELSYTRILGMGVIGVWALVTILNQKIRRIHPFFIFTLLFIAWNLLSFYWTIDLELTTRRAKTYAQLGIMSLMIWDLVDDKGKLRAVLEVYLLGALISAVGTILNFVFGIEAYLYSGGRYAASGFNANDLAIILALGIPMAWYLVISTDARSKSKWLSVFNVLYILLSLFAIILTGSRAGFLVTIIALGYIFLTLFRLKSWVKVSFVAIFAVFIFIAVTIIPAATIDRVLSAFSVSESGDLGGRLAIYAAAAKSVDAHPLIGIGSGAFRSATELNIIAHNTFLSVLSETGIIGFLFFICMLIVCLIEIMKQPQKEMMFCLTLLLMWGLGGSSVSWDFRKPTWLLLSLILIIAELFMDKKRVTTSDMPAEKFIHLGNTEQTAQNFSESLIKR